jgi:uroporphyrin-III C-methyltransferase
VSSGQVWLVGAGPGDPDLLTVRARRLVETADAVVHDRLVGPGVLALVPIGIPRLDVGKSGHGHAVPQSETNALLIRLAASGQRVVRLKGGDPFVFGRGWEELSALRQAGVRVEVVPGVTAGIAGPALAGIPITHRGLARSVALVTGHEEACAGGDPVDWAAIASADTLVVYMAGRSAQGIASRLLGAGRRPDTPTAVIVDASLSSQEVRICDLGSLATVGPGALDGRATLLVIGEVVSLRDRIVHARWPDGASVGVGVALASVER